MDSFQQSDIDYQKQLRQIACKVDNFIVNNPEELQHFRNSIKPLAKRWKDYQQAIQDREQVLSEHWELVKKNPKLQDKNNNSFEKKDFDWDMFYLGDLDSFGSNPINEMPAKYASDLMVIIEKCLKTNYSKIQELAMLGKYAYAHRSIEYQNLLKCISVQRQNLEDIHSEFDALSPVDKKTAWIKTPPKIIIPNKTYVKFTWWKYLNLDDELVFGCWRPKLKPLPENPPDRLKPTDEEYRSKQRELQTLPIARNEAEEYERYYIFLSSVHDNCLPEVEQITKDIWSDYLKEAVWELCDMFFGDKTAFLNSALERVKYKYSWAKPRELKQNEAIRSQQEGQISKIDLMRQLAKRLRRTADQLKMLKSNHIGIFAGSEMGIHKIVTFLRLNKPSMADQVQAEWNDIMSRAKDIDQLIIDSSRTAFEKAKLRQGSLKHNLHKLAETLEDTSRNLAAEKNVKTEQKIEPKKEGTQRKKRKESADSKKLKEYINCLPKRLEKLVNTSGKKTRLEVAKNQLEKDCEDFDRWAMKRDPLSYEYAQKCEEVYQKEMPRYIRWARQYYYIVDGILEPGITETPPLDDRERTLAAYYAVLSLCEIAKNEAFLNEYIDGDNELLVEMGFIKKGYVTDIITRLEEAFSVIEEDLKGIEPEPEKPTSSPGRLIRQWEQLDELDQKLVLLYEETKNDKKIKFPTLDGIKNIIIKSPGLPLKLKKMTREAIRKRIKKLTEEEWIEHYPYHRHKKKQKEVILAPEYIDDMVKDGKAHLP